MTRRIAIAVLPLFAVLTAAPSAANVEGRAWGDIHVQTMDGAGFDFQQSGEFVASRSDAGDLEVQLRLESSGFSSNVSVVTAVALQIDSTRASVALGRKPALHVEGRPTDLPDDFLDLPGGGRIEKAKKGYEIYWADGSALTLNVRKRHINAFLRPAEERRGTLTGLFGNFNGTALDDVDATVAAMGPNAGGTEYRQVFAEVARELLADDEDPRLLTQKASLFEYGPGESTHSFRRPKPTREASPENLPAGWREHARKVCEDAGVTDPEILAGCIVDVGYTRDESFAETALFVQERDVTNWDERLAQR